VALPQYLGVIEVYFRCNNNCIIAIATGIIVAKDGHTL